VPLHERFGKLASLTNWHTPEFVILGDASATGSLTEVILDQPQGQVDLAFVDLASPGVEAFLYNAQARGRNVLTRILQRSPYIAIQTDWTTYEDRLARKLKSEVRRRRRRLEHEGDLALEIVDGTCDLEEHLLEAFRVEAAGWKGDHGTAILSQRNTESFYKEVAQWSAGRAWLRLAFLKVDDRPIAFDFALETEVAHYLVKTSYDPAFQKFGPGVLLRYDMIARAFSLGISRYEFLGGNRQWKQVWTHTCHDRYLVQAFHPSLTGRARKIAYEYGRPLLKSMRRSLRAVIKSHDQSTPPYGR
jgi:CelD/BcsL family acetyltransferase involved in cellulose biosynthesis